MPARPRVITEDELIKVEALASVLTSEQIADYLGIGRTTFYTIMDRQPEVSERYKKGRAKAIGTVAQGLLKRAQDGDTASAIFYLKTKAGWKETTVTEQTGKDGGPIETKSTVEAGPGVQGVLDALKRASSRRSEDCDEGGNQD